MHQRREFPAFYSHFKVTSGQMTSLPVHFRSREDCLHLRATALLEVKRNKDAVVGFLQPHIGDFRSNDITSGTFPVTEVT